MAQGDRDSQPRRAYIVVRVDIEKSFWNEDQETRARFVNGITLAWKPILKAQNEGPANRYWIALAWSTLQPIPDDYAAFVHWVRGGQVVAQVDATPGSGYWPAPTWRPGDSIGDFYTLAVPNGAQPGDEIQVGLYRRSDNQRLKVVDADEKSTGDYVIIPNP